jgi:transposase
MEANYYAGVDISKKRLDWQVDDAKNNLLFTGKAINTPNGIRTLLDQWSRRGIDAKQTVVCFEHTGPYGLLLATLLEQAGICYVLVPASQVQHSLGIRRGKSDPIDARRLACFAGSAPFPKQSGQPVALRSAQNVVAQWRTLGHPV